MTMDWRLFIDRWIYVFMAATFVVVALAGFVPNSLRKIAAVAAGEREPFPVILHIHAVLMGAWLLLVLAQTVLMATGRQKFHMQLGLVSIVVAPAMVIVGIMLAPTMMGPFLQTFGGRPGASVQDIEIAVTGILLWQIRTGILFSLFVGWALLVRRSDSALHKRLMILATAVPMGAAVDRIAFLPRPSTEAFVTLDFYLLLMIAPLLVWDLFRLGRVHRAYLIFFSVFAAVSVPAYLLWGTPWWVATARTMLMGAN